MARAARFVNIAFEGCCHSELDSIYASVAKLDHKIDLLIIGGDFQAARNKQDLNCMSIPPKYRRLGDFADYYSGRKKAPVLTIFIGGNHEASNYMWELFYGGWVAPNIYYLGAANVVTFAGLRIGGLSGIWSRGDYDKGHFERVPYNHSTTRSAYHIRRFDVKKLASMTAPVDVMLSHDWPAGIEHHGDTAELLRRKQHFREDVAKGELGSPPAWTLLRTLRPRYWFSAHLHVKFAALVKHDDTPPAPAAKPPRNKDEIALDLDMDDIEPVAPAAPSPPPAYVDVSTTSFSLRRTATAGATRFLALDKCLPRRSFLQAFRIKVSGAGARKSLAYDPEWLAITRAYDRFFSDAFVQPADFARRELEPDLVKQIELERQWVEQNIVVPGKLKVPHNFAPTAPSWAEPDYYQPKEYNDPQTARFCKLLGIANRIYKPSQN
ncbi:DBR1-domain-containing protein [Dipodascopsis tothii]|uniref:DBR1-domain-containing protein n=1 Tax=Dipodascopsis tothii TaxID=44089 RepID=UPI0034CE7191